MPYQTPNSDLTPSNDRAWDELLDALHGSSITLAMVAAGGGSGAIAHCFRRPGASQTFVEAVIPYSRAAMRDYLGGVPREGSASIATARQLARRSFQRSAKLWDQDADALHATGLALVAAMPTRSRRQDLDRIHVATQTVDHVATYSLEFRDDQFTRSAAETISDEMIFLALACLSGARRNGRFFDEARLRPTIEHANTPADNNGNS